MIMQFDSVRVRLFSTIALSAIATNAPCRAEESSSLSTAAATVTATRPPEKVNSPLSPNQDEQERTKKSVVTTDATVHVPSFDLPFSALASEQARQRFLDSLAHPLPVVAGDIVKTRQAIDDQLYKPLIKQLREMFSVTITPQEIAGVQTDVVTPAEGVSAKNASRVLLNLHGGGFSGGARYGGMIESIPIASVGKFKVITIDYREGPENRFPAASEDVAAVFRSLLRQYRHQDIGIYGCSAGGVLTAQSVAWFQTHELPAPGAVGIFGAGASMKRWGDTAYIAGPINGGNVKATLAPETMTRKSFDHIWPYFIGADLADPLVSPGDDPSVLAKFPPTLIINSIRDPTLSSAVYTHTQLIKAGVDADLHVWEGVGHCFFFMPDLPESQEAWQIIGRFFDSHLGH